MLAFLSVTSPWIDSLFASRLNADACRLRESGLTSSSQIIKRFFYLQVQVEKQF